ncbi:MAG: homocysteine S-methyltransferase family protein [Chloroflexi bacterium]|nr:homocysteine S-methyltransferase family protein [Chloroflexota bacterium]
MAITFEGLISLRTPIVFDGATGTLLQQMGLPMRQAPETWVLEQPASVYTAAESYVNAGAQIILTCTFGGTSVRLLDSGLDARAYEINRRAAELAKQAAGGHALVAGSIGPIGRLPLAMGTLTYTDAVEQFGEQARALAEGGVDLFSVESMSDVAEMMAAIEGVRRVADKPILASMSFDTQGKTLMGITPAYAALELSKAGVAAFGANCGRGPEDVTAILQEMHSTAHDALLIAKPNAGVPEIRAGGAVYPVPAERFAAHARDWVRAGARIVGGCCGTTPRYVEALRSAIGGGKSASTRRQLIQ